MPATAKTIGFLRTLTSDNLLSEDEVWALARFFNDNPECTEMWPGDLLAPMLNSAFDDAQLSTSPVSGSGARAPSQESVASSRAERDVRD